MANNELLLKTEKVDFSIGNVQILKNISIEFEQGVFYGIIGPNGSGKTTLLDVLCGYKQQTFGEIIMGGKPINNYSKRILAKLVSLVPQAFDIPFPFTVEDVIKMGRHPFRKRFTALTEKDIQIIDEVIEILALSPFLNRDFTTLSGGEKQRVIFARALVQDTPLIFLDEATSNLDPYFCHSLLIVLERWVKKRRKTVVSVFHDLNLASLYCDELLMMKAGQVVKKGETSHIINAMNIEEIFKIKAEINQTNSTGKPFVLTKGIS